MEGQAWFRGGMESMRESSPLTMTASEVMLYWVKRSEVVISVVVIGSRFSGEAHAGEGSELGVNVGFQMDVEVNEGLRN